MTIREHRPGYSFSSFEAANPSNPKPGAALDNENFSIARSLQDIRAYLGVGATATARVIATEGQFPVSAALSDEILFVTVPLTAVRVIRLPVLTGIATFDVVRTIQSTGAFTLLVHDSNGALVATLAWHADGRYARIAYDGTTFTVSYATDAFPWAVEGRLKGVYSALEDYAPGDEVSFDGSSYVARRYVPVGIAPPDATYWQLRAAWIPPGSAGDINVLDYNAVGDGVADDTAECQAALTYAAGVATAQRPVKVIFPKGYAFRISSTLTVGSNIELTGGGALLAAATLPFTSPIFRNTTVLTSSNTRVNSNIKIRGLIFDGVSRVYPEWLQNPITGVAITDPEADYSSIGPTTSTLNAALYPSGDIDEVIAANRRNPATYNLRGGLIEFSGCIDSEVVGCEFRNHMSEAIRDIGGLRNRIADNRFDNIGRVSFSSNAVLVADYGSMRIVTNMTKASPPTFECVTALPVTVGAQLRTRNILWGGLADGLYTVSATSGNNVTVTGLDTTGFASTFTFNGRALVTTAAYVQAEFVTVENNTFYNLKRAAIQITGSRHIVRGNRVLGSQESGIYLINLLDSTISDNLVAEVRYSDLVANGMECNWIVGCTITNNVIRHVNENGVTFIGGFDCDVRNNTIFRSGNEGPSARRFGPFSERYQYGAGTAIIAGTSSSSEYKAPIRIQSSGTLPSSGRITCNTLSDTRVTPVHDAAIVCNQTSGIASITATIDNGSGASGTALTVSAISAGMIALGMTVTGSGVTPTRITGFVSGTYGGVGVYTVDTAHNLTSRAMTANAWRYVRDLQIIDNDMTTYPTSDPNLLIDLGGVNVTDAQTSIVRGNKKHPSQAAFTLIEQAVTASGFLDLVCNFPPSAIEIETFYPDGTTAYPLSHSRSSISKTQALQGPSSTTARTMVFADTAGRFSANVSNFVIRLNGTGGLQFAAEFVRFNPDGFRINVTNNTQPVFIRARCYP